LFRLIFIDLKNVGITSAAPCTIQFPVELQLLYRILFGTVFARMLNARLYRKFTITYTLGLYL